ncbi:class I SAM-dependent methyltransferase [Gordonia sp. NPDC062954]|uniref:class I SAM-dependent methyltransferase n=1 Tax=Gordonia sp. NPDC062954 TaxID=3364003 RepID=UPI0037C9D173
MQDDKIGSRYAQVADLYIDMFGSPDRVDAADRAFIARHLGDVSGPVLDVGCGPGHLTAYLADLGVAARGIDLVPGFVHNARSTRPDLDFTVGSVRALDVPDGSLSGILAWYSLIHHDPHEVAEIATEFRRAMVGGGVLVVGFFEGAVVEPFDHKVATAYRRPVDDMSAVLAAAGFVEIERTRRAGTDTARAHAALAVRAR